MTRAAVLALALAAVAAGCDVSQTGTLTIGLTTAPGSTLLDGVRQLRLTFTAPPQVIVLDRTERGFDLALDLPATGDVGALSIDGLDAGGALAATGASPPYPLAATDARIVVYMAPPMSIGPAPAALDPARTRASAAALGYGAILAGGVDGAGAPSAALGVYNAYNHGLVTGLPLPAPRVGAAIAVTSHDDVYLLGGEGPDGAATGTLWFFDTHAAPAGNYTEQKIPSPPAGLARAGAAAIPIGGDGFLLTGAPPIQLGGAALARAVDLPAISSGVTVTAADRTITTIAVDAGTGELVQIRGGQATGLGAQQAGAVVVALPGAQVAAIGGAAAPRDAVLVDPASGALTPVPGALAEAYESLAVAATARFVVVAGRRAGAPGTAIEVLDAQTLARRHAETIADAITAAIALPNGQVLLVGATLQLFTPPPATAG